MTKHSSFVDNEFISSRGSVYTVEVDHSLKVTDVSDRFFHISPYVNDHNFPSARRGVEDVEIHVVRFKLHGLNEHVERFEDMSEFMLRQGFRSATLQELLALDAQQSHLKHKGGFTLGYVRTVLDGHRVVPGIHTDPRNRAYLANMYLNRFTPSHHLMMDSPWRVVAVSL